MTVQVSNVSREQAEAVVTQAAAKLGLQVNGAVANAQAVADAFNAFQTSFNQYQDHVRRIAEESETLKRENKALHATVTELKNKLAKPVRAEKQDPKAAGKP